MTILTPKGYSPASQPSRERPTPEQEPEKQASAQDLPVGERAEPLEERIRLHFPPQVVGINCPSCSTPFPAQIFSIIDVGQDPALKSLLLSGQVNVAICPRCGAGGSIGSPLLYHDPEHDFLGVFVPGEIASDEQQKIIGQLSKRHMDSLPPEDRRGYMLTPKQFLSYQSLIEAVLENEGVTKEMLEKQRRQLQLIDQALTALQDPEGLRLLVGERDAEMDEEFFSLLNMVSETNAAGGNAESVRELVELSERLIELTTWGQGVQKQRAAVAQIKPDTTSRQLLEMVLETDDRKVVNALIAVGRPLIDYSFYQELANRINVAQRSGNSDLADQLSELRAHILDYVDKLDQVQQAMFEQTSKVLSDILAANDIQQAVAERAQNIDQNFLSVVSANLQEAERRQATAATRRLQEVWNAAVGVMQQSAPPQIRLINDLVDADYPSETRKLLANNRELVTPELIEVLTGLADELEGEGNTQVAAKLRQVRSQAQLMR